MSSGKPDASTSYYVALHGFVSAIFNAPGSCTKSEWPVFTHTLQATQTSLSLPFSRTSSKLEGLVYAVVTQTTLLKTSLRVTQL